ncbi:hypothetical protein [Streptosporangium sp. NPDC000509]|uniref:hypothetical protein n=1 Tax=Streptosporangium sp. NPDC000509 TaxID=3366186 RepID=UPI0036CB582B
MNNLNAPVLDRTTTSGCACFADVPPLPMGCAVCGHAPYAHHCPGQAIDHEYAQPTGTLMAMRLEARRRTGPQPFPMAEQPVVVAPAEVIPLVPAQRRSEPPAPTAPTPLPERTPPSPFPRPALRPAAIAPARRDDSRRPAPRPVETRTDRATRLALVRDTLAHRKARIAARAHDHSAPPPNMGLKSAAWPLAPQTLRPGPAAPGRSRPPNIPSPRRHQPHRWEVAA